MPYQLKREDIFAFAQFIGAETRQKGNELEFKECPLCHGGSHDEWTFSINLETGAFCCLRATCGYKGHFVELCRDFDYVLDDAEYTRYRKLKQFTDPIKPKSTAVKYLESRGISREVAERYEVTVKTKAPKVMVFPFFDDRGILRTVKYRNMAFKKGESKGSKEWFEENTMPILFGMKQCVDFGRLIITEGQIDALSVAECGFHNVVSVPNGANGSTWISNCWEWVNKFSELLIFGDYEKGKITLVDMISNRFQMPIKVVRKQDYLGEKDANDILTTFGKTAIEKCINNAEPPHMENVRDLSTVKSVDINLLDKIKFGISSVDRIIGGAILGQVILLTGKRGEGKSTFLSQAVCSALNQNRSVFIYSGELPSFHFKRWLDLQLAGINHIQANKNEYGDYTYTITDETVERISNWYKGRAFIYDNSYVPMPNSQAEQETLPQTIERVIRQYNVQLVCIDNLMTAMESVMDKDNLYLAQSNFVGKLKEIAIKYQVAILLVAHPRKSKEEFVNDDVSGSSDITNKVDVVMSYTRANKQTDQSKLQITKNRLFGRLAIGSESIPLEYSEASRRIYSKLDKPYVYGWETEPPEEELEDLPF